MSDLPRPFGTYTLLKLLARGGMGEIYLARTSGITGFEKYYAVKKLLKKFTHDNDVGARFIDEAKLGARLQHPNIVQVYDLGRVTDELYMATEFVDGFDLRRVLRFCHEKKKRIPLDIALFIVREILSGLAYAHRQVDAEGHSINLIHRDISPQNVLVSFEGEVKIIDFGLAKSTQRSQETQANVLLGNFGYMSPEQARGHQLDVRTDVYSAGIVLFELVTGTKRFVEENPLRLLEMVARPTPIVPSDRVPGTPKTIDRIYSKATSPAKEDRFESAESFRDDITTALHRINPKASRENLAQFLNHLFLGGAAPAPIDSDALDDKSVAIRARDLHEASDAFQQPAESDVKDRRLHEFSDDAPQTASHPLMRQARAGDVLTHQQLTGEDALQSPASTAVRPPASSSSLPSPPVGASLDDASPAEPASATSAASAAGATNAASAPSAPSAQIATASPAVEVDDDDLDVDIRAPTAERPAAGALVPDLGPGPGEAIAGTPTSIYDSPEWPGQLDREAAASEPLAHEEVEAAEIIDVDAAHAADDVQAQIDAQALLQQDDLQAELQRQLDAQLEQQAAQEELQRQLDAQAAAERAAQLRPPPSPRPPPPAGARGPAATTGQTTVVTTVGPPPKRPVPSQDAPSIVVSMDLDPSEPTVVGVSGEPRASLRQDLNRTVEVSPVTDKARSGGGFADGGVHESLIIDFDGEAAAAEPKEAEVDKSIRPAAQPLGKRVVPAVAQPKARTNPGGRLPDESATGSSMPPPTRRRS